MKKFILTPTNSTPEVIFDYSAGILKINGICTPENPKLFYEPIMGILNDYFNNQTYNHKLIIEINLEYFNSGSSKALLNLFIVSSKSCADLAIRWISEDEELKESGAILEEISGLKFEYIDINPQE